MGYELKNRKTGIIVVGVLIVVAVGVGGFQQRMDFASVEASSVPWSGPRPFWSTIIDYNDQGVLLYPERVIQTADGGYAVLCRITSHNGTIWLGQFDAQGTLLWEQIYKIDYRWGAGAPRDFYQCADGGFAVIGITPNIQGDWTHFLIRTEPDGTLRWKMMFPLLSSNIDQHGSSVIECTDGGFIMTGWRESEVFLHRINPDGEYLWHQVYPSSGQKDVDLVQCADTGFALAGKNSTDYIFLARINSTGGVLWKQSYTFPGAIQGLYFAGLKLTNDNGFVLYGQTYGQGPNSDALDIYLLRTDMNDTEQWNYTYGGPLSDIVNDVVQCTDEGFVLIGSTWRIDLDLRDIWLVRTNATGNQNWNCTYPDHLPKGTWGVGILEPEPGVLVICADIWKSSSSLWLFSIPDVSPPDPNLPFLGIPPELIPAIIIGLAVVVIIVIFAFVWILRQRRM